MENRHVSHRKESTSPRLSTTSCCAVLLVWIFITPAQPVSAGTIEKTNTEQSGIFDSLKGQPTENQFFLGMFTLHLNSKSRRIRNWKQNLIGLQYKDFYVSTFKNSFYNRTWAAGMARNLYTKQLSNQWDMTTGYRLGLAYGYKHGEAPFSSASPIIPTVEVYVQSVYRKHLGIELMLTSSIGMAFFYQF